MLNVDGEGSIQNRVRLENRSKERANISGIFTNLSMADVLPLIAKDIILDLPASFLTRISYGRSNRRERYLG